jgi:hypothetical protein
VYKLAFFHNFLHGEQEKKCRGSKVARKLGKAIFINNFLHLATVEMKNAFPISNLFSPFPFSRVGENGAAKTLA